MSAVLLAAGCSPAKAPRPPNEPPGPVSTRTKESQTAKRTWATRLVPPPASGSSQEFRYGVSRVVQIHASGVRREYSEAGLAVGTDFLTERVKDYSDSEHGVLWMTQRHAVYRSASVTGHLERIEGLQASSVAVVGPHGYACTPRGELVRVSLSEAPEVSTLGHPCASVLSHDEALLLEHPPGAWSRSEDQAESFSPGAAPALEGWDYGWHRTSLPIDANSDIVRRADRLLGTWRDEAGRIYSVSRHDGANVLSSDGTWSPVRAPRGLSCDYEPSARALMASCTTHMNDHSVARRLFEYQDGWNETFAGSPGLARSNHRTQLSVSRVDGSAVLLRACDLDWTVDAPDLPPPLCVVQHDAPARTLRRWAIPKQPVPECDDDDFECQVVRDELAEDPPSPSMGDYQHPHLLIAHDSSGAYALDVRAGRVTLSGLPAIRGAMWVGPSWLFFLPPGKDTDRTFQLAHIEGNEAILVPLPDGVRSVAFADARRGIAAGKTAEAVWTTTDGGQTWTPREIAVVGHPSHVELESATCTNVVCSARPFVWADEGILDRFDLPDVRFIAPHEPARQTERKP